MKTKVEKRESLNDVDDTLLGFDDTTTDRDWVGNERWTPEKTRLMLELRFERQSQFQTKDRQKKEIWAEIAAEMKAVGGFVLSGESCDLKYRNMLQTYKKNRLKEERGQQSMIVWEFYDMFKEAMRTCSGMMMDDLVPSMLCESVCIDDDDCNDVMNNSDNLLSAMMAQPQQLQSQSAPAMPKEKVGKSKQYTQAIKIEPSFLTEGKTRSTRSATKRHRSSPKHEIVNNIDSPDADNQLPEEEKNSLPSSHTAHSTANVVEPSHLRQKLTVPIPVGLSGSELFECQTFGDSIGMQLAHIKDSQTRAFCKLKIQELIYLAKMGKLSDDLHNTSRF